MQTKKYLPQQKIICKKKKQIQRNLIKIKKEKKVKVKEQKQDLSKHNYSQKN